VNNHVQGAKLLTWSLWWTIATNIIAADATTYFHNLYSSPSIFRTIKSRMVRWAGHVARMGEKRNACRIFVGFPVWKRQLVRPRRRWVDNIKMDLREIGWNGMDWIDLAQDRYQWRALVNTVMNLRVPLNAEKFLSSCTIGDFSRRAQLREWEWVKKLSNKNTASFFSMPCSQVSSECVPPLMS
jgi:hypothetical protein